MDLPNVVQQLEGFGLENFIKAFGHSLCKKTVSSGSVALALKFSSDEISIINHPPDSFSKCQKLFELIQKKCGDKVGDFIEALKDSGNEHVIIFIQSILADPSSAEQIPSSSFNTNNKTLNTPDSNLDTTPIASTSAPRAQAIFFNYGASQNSQGSVNCTFTQNINVVQAASETELAKTRSMDDDRPGIWFKIPEPIDSFCGREDFLKELHEKLQNQHPLESIATEAVASASQPDTKSRSMSTLEVTVLSQVKIVSGLGGIGKTETATQYTWTHRNSYNNFIWIDAESESSMSNSFIKLASELQIPVKNEEGKPREIEEIVKEIYTKICGKGKFNLIVFDNAEDYQSCQSFFPISINPDLRKQIVILATSRNQEWISDAGKITVLPLDVLTEDESLEFILKQLEIEDSPEFREESREFIQLIGGLPLALQQAIAFIKQQKKDNRLLGLPYKMSDYVNQFKSSAKKLQNFPISPGSSATVFITWNLTFDKIKKDPKGKIAIEIIHVMSLLYADKIPIKFLHQLLPLPRNWLNRLFKLCRHRDLDFGPTDLVEGLNLLEKFSMIKIDSTDNFMSVHRQVQFVVIQNLKSCGEIVKLFDHLVKNCGVILENVKLSESDDIFLNVHQIVKNLFYLIPMAEKYIDFMDKFGAVLWRASRYSESLDLYQKIHSKRRELLEDNHWKTLFSQNMIALQLCELGRYEESLELYRKTLRQMEIHLGPDHPSTTGTKHNIAIVLREQEKYEEALEILQQVLAQQKQILGGNHPWTLQTQHVIATLHSGLMDWPKALALYQDLEKKQTEILGTDHRQLLTTKHNKAFVLFLMDEVGEASEIFNEVYEKMKEILGENHLNTIATLDCIARTLVKQGEWEEALELFTKVYEIRKTNLGENHPQTIHAKAQVEFFEEHELRWYEV